MKKGRLFVVATPIGNLEDITARALRILREAHLIAAEDTRHSRRLLDHYGIDTPLTSYHEHNEVAKAESLLDTFDAGRDIALISDAGTPAISDPGYRLVKAARDHGVEVIAIPGPSAVLAALSASGLPTDRFTFHGFFPRKPSQSDALLDELGRSPGTHVFFESPHRLHETLERLAARLPHVQACVARELTKLHEELIHGTPGELAVHYGSASPKGECVLLVHVSAPDRPDALEPAELKRMVDQKVELEGLSRRDAIKSVAIELGLPRNMVYAAAMEES